MKYKFVFASSFNSDLDAASNYISTTLDNKKAAHDLLVKVKDKISLLADFPEMYTLCSDARLMKRGIRKLIINNYIVLYSVEHKQKTINFLRFVYAKSNYAYFV